ncbi:unnamed protein product [Cylicostephanus goldi]|uniref:Uncharacterized protein n=1 Tax=Cylicostephanus goldi TaxID=71465 RepID=A0A3P7Q2F4_CYLGO|nr:unnamed protein product [Cylicostephanus goldi]
MHCFIMPIHLFSVSDADTREVADDSSVALQAHEQDCFAVAIADERWLASGGEDDVAYLWDQQVSDSDPVLKIDHRDSVTSVAFNNAQTLLSTGDMSGHIVITQLADLQPRAKVYAGNGSPCTAGHILPDGKRLLAGYGDGVVSQSFF